MLDIIDRILSDIFKIHENGGTGYVLLWGVIVCLFLVVIQSNRKNKKIQESYETWAKKEFDECQKHNAKMDADLVAIELKHEKLRKKYTMIVGMLVVLTGRRTLPPDFWTIVLDENIETIPNIAQFPVEPEKI